MNMIQEDLLKDALFKVAQAGRNLSEAAAEMKKVMDGYGSNCYWQAGDDAPEIRCYKHRDSAIFNEPCGGPPQSDND